jgi:uncharacterized UPF0160 family protein
MTQETVSNELIFEVLKKIQDNVAHIRTRVDDHDQQFIAMREQIHNLEGHILRLDRQMVERLGRIERRFELVDA